MRMVLLGAPGSGKGTQAVLLTRSLNVIHISTGNIFRQANQDDTELGRKVSAYMNQGLLVPDQIVLDIIRECLSPDDYRKGFILDGFPRTLPQAEGLQELLSNLHTPLDIVISLEVPTEHIIKRLSARRVCQRCGKDYNMDTNPPPADMIHPGCGGRIVQRNDDLPDTIRNRIEVYRRQTEPLKEYYRQEDILAEVDGVGTVDEVFDRVIRLLPSR